MNLKTREEWIDMGNAYANKGKLDNAIECYENAIKIDPDDAITWSNLGLVYDDKGEHDKAITSLEKAIEKDPDFATAWYNLGLAYGHKGECEKAIECYKKSIEIDPIDGCAWNNMGDVYEDKGETDKAIKCYKKSIEIDPKDVCARNNLIFAYVHKGEFDKILEIEPNNDNAIKMKKIKSKNQQLADKIKEFLVETFPNIIIQIENDVEEPKKRNIFFVEERFKDLYPDQRCHLILHKIPENFCKKYLENTHWFELAPGEHPKVLEYMDDEEVCEIRDEILLSLLNVNFFNLLEEKLEECNNDFSISKSILKKLNIKEEKLIDIFHVLMDAGGYCDCEILLNAWEEAEELMDN